MVGVMNHHSVYVYTLVDVPSVVDCIGEMASDPLAAHIDRQIRLDCCFSARLVVSVVVV